ncbi:hypothetical protein B0T16DRAFT_227142 [Cercophora newfieldiana]|uniref:Uncharacterized protein n=1 Tax=Cercophora newfieldiana TaxID=92897 RepID=A0AA39XR43_9PEZI|nr:hypothetical protein B0T16DRAFT_227142 [Cercophora newfieldiana]
MEQLLQTATCISADDHLPASPGDHILHYFACIDICDRGAYLSPQHPAWQNEAGIERKKLERQNQDLHANAETNADLEAEIKRRVNSKITELATEVLRRYRRIAAIRIAIQKERTNYNPTPIPTTDKDLVECVTEGHARWKGSTEFKNNIDAVRTWRQQRGLHVDHPANGPTSGGDDSEMTALRSWVPTDEEDLIPQYAIDEDVQVHVMRFQKPHSGDSPSWDSGPRYQRRSVASLLHKGSSLSHQDTLQYIHFPYNNLKWVESALKHYARLEENIRRRSTADPAQGEQNSVHGRHFPPTCQFLSADEPSGSAAQISVMMPYLHWETDRNREAFSRIIGAETARHKARMREMVEQDHEQRQALRAGLPPPIGPRIPHLTGGGARFRSGAALPPMIPTWSGILSKVLRISPSSDVRVEQETGRLRTTSPLGQFLLDAARLYSVMSTFRDRKMMETYLFNKAPLHPRRTLDQSNSNWATETTRERDRDQVVFRATDYKPEDRHRLRREWDAEPWWFWNGHADFEDSPLCTTCRNASRPTPRVTMVDHLWMYVVGQNTLLTFFPARYGTDEMNDSSGVGSAIRQILHAKTNPRSALDLALVVLEESSMSLLSRGATGDGKPDVLQIFREAIGSLARREVRERTRVWRINYMIQNLKKWSGDAGELTALLLDSTPEGRLQFEAKDIVEELDIMIHITKSQVTVIREFLTHAEELFSSDEAEAWAQFMKSHGRVLRRVQAGLEGLEMLQATARNTSQTIDDLVSLKQQQITILQTWQSAEQGEEAVKQGKALPIFTMFTIIFLPLSFMTSIFGMNAAEFEDGAWSVRDQFKIIFPVSIVVMFATLQLTYFDFARELLISLATYLFTFISIKTGAYTLWLNFSYNFNPHYIRSNRTARITKMRRDARADKRREQEKKRTAEQRRWAEKYAKDSIVGDVGAEV